MAEIRLPIREGGHPEVIVVYSSIFGILRNAKVYYKNLGKLHFPDRKSLKQGGSFKTDEGEEIRIYYDGLLRAELDGKPLPVDCRHLNLRIAPSMVIAGTLGFIGIFLSFVLDENFVIYFDKPLIAGAFAAFVVLAIAALASAIKGLRTRAISLALGLIPVSILLYWQIWNMGYGMIIPYLMFGATAALIWGAFLCFRVSPDNGLWPGAVPGREYPVADKVFLFQSGRKLALFNRQMKLSPTWTVKELKKGVEHTLPGGRKAEIYWVGMPVVRIDGRMTETYRSYSDKITRPDSWKVILGLGIFCIVVWAALLVKAIVLHEMVFGPGFWIPASFSLFFMIWSGAIRWQSGLLYLILGAAVVLFGFFSLYFRVKENGWTSGVFNVFAIFYCAFFLLRNAVVLIRKRGIERMG